MKKIILIAVVVSIKWCVGMEQQELKTLPVKTQSSSSPESSQELESSHSHEDGLQLTSVARLSDVERSNRSARNETTNQTQLSRTRTLKAPPKGPAPVPPSKKKSVKGESLGSSDSPDNRNNTSRFVKPRLGASMSENNFNEIVPPLCLNKLGGAPDSPVWHKARPTTPRDSFDEVCDEVGNKSPGNQRTVTIGAKARPAEVKGYSLRGAKVPESEVTTQSAIELMQESDIPQEAKAEKSPRKFLSLGRAAGKAAEKLGQSSKHIFLRNSDLGEHSKRASDLDERNEELLDSSAKSSKALAFLGLSTSSDLPKSPRSPRFKNNADSLVTVPGKNKEAAVEKTEKKSRIKNAAKEKAETKFKVALFEVSQELQRDKSKKIDEKILDDLLQKAENFGFECISLLSEWLNGQVKNERILVKKIKVLKFNSPERVEKFVMEWLDAYDKEHTDGDSHTSKANSSSSDRQKIDTVRNLKKIQKDEDVSTMTAVEIYQREDDEKMRSSDLGKSKNKGIGKIFGLRPHVPSKQKEDIPEFEVTEDYVNQGSREPLSKEYCSLCRKLLKDKISVPIDGMRNISKFSSRCDHFVHSACMGRLALVGGELCRVQNCHKAVVPSKEYRKLKNKLREKQQVRENELEESSEKLKDTVVEDHNGRSDNENLLSGAYAFDSGSFEDPVQELNLSGRLHDSTGDPSSVEIMAKQNQCSEEELDYDFSSSEPKDFTNDEEIPKSPRFVKPLPLKPAKEPSASIGVEKASAYKAPLPQAKLSKEVEEVYEFDSDDADTVEC